MKKRPKENQKVYWIGFDYSPCGSRDVEIAFGRYGEGCDPHTFNLFPSRKAALKAKRKIIKILRG